MAGMVARRTRSRVLLLQFRLFPEAERQEQECVRRVGGLAADEVEARNLANQPTLHWEDVRDADALVLGGAGEFSLTSRHPFLEPLEEVAGRWIDEGRPLFGSCFGHHLLGLLAGGRVIADAAAEEVGTFDVELTAAGRLDPLLAGLPERFLAQLGHHDRIADAGERLVELARSGRCPMQIVRFADKPVYGTQFHAELDAGDMRARLRMYPDYLPDDAANRAFEESLSPTPVAVTILGRFLDLFVR